MKKDIHNKPLRIWMIALMCFIIHHLSFISTNAQTYSGTSPVTITAPWGATNIQWYKDEIALAGQTNPNYTTSTAGLYYAIYNDPAGCSNQKSQITVLATDCAVGGGLPVNINGATNASITGYQWYKNETIIAGQTSSSYAAIVGGTYSVKYTQTGGCVSNSDKYYVFVMACPSAAVAAVGTIDCPKTQIIPAPVAGTASQVDLIVSINVTTAGSFSPLTVSGSGMSVANGVTAVTTTTTGIQTFHIPVKYDGTALGTMSFTVGAAGSCTADLTKTPKKAITDVWTLDCVTTAGPALK